MKGVANQQFTFEAYAARVGVKLALKPEQLSRTV
jgi:hypothetical protein